MKTLLVLLALTAFLASCAKPGETKIVTVPGQAAAPAQAQAPVTPKTQVDGTVNGGGGKGVVCKKNGKTTVEVLDLYEARKIYGLKLIDLGNDEDAAIDKIATRMINYTESPWTGDKKESFDWFRKTVKEQFLGKLAYTTPDQTLKHIPDANEVLLEAGCEYVQIAVYYDESVIIVDKMWWDQLDWTNKLALINHEIAYHETRLTGAKNSIGARKFVGHLFSEPGLRPKYAAVPRDPTKRLECRVKNQQASFADFFAYNVTKDEGQPQAEIVFTQLQGQENLFRTTALSRRSIEQWMQKDVAGSELANIKVDSYFSVGDSKVQMSIEFSGEGKGTVHFINQAEGTTSPSMNLVCFTQKR